MKKLKLTIAAAENPRGWRWSAYLLFDSEYRRRQVATFGEDPYPLGIRAMRKTLERAIQGSYEQGLIRKPVKVEDLYPAATLDT